MKGLVLLVEDNEQILRGNEKMLRRNGYETISAMTLQAAYAAVNERKPDAIVLDIMLPDGSGLDFMRELRRSSDVPILLLTGLTTSTDIIRGLSDGGDDYLTKPYDFGVLLARVEAMLRLSSRIPRQLVKGELTLDIRANRAFFGGEDMLLTQKEFAVLLLLAENENQVLSTGYIYETVWKQAPNSDMSGAVKTVISRLRRKLNEDFYIENNREVDGYVLAQGST